MSQNRDSSSGDVLLAVEPMQGGGGGRNDISSAPPSSASTHTPSTFRPLPPASGIAMEDSGAKYHCFLSHYQATGGDQCLILREALSKRGVSVWYDQDGLEGGATWEGMARAVQSSDVVLCFLSDNLFSRGAVHWELHNALVHHKPILFVADADVRFEDLLAQRDRSACLTDADFAGLFPGNQLSADILRFHTGPPLDATVAAIRTYLDGKRSFPFAPQLPLTHKIRQSPLPYDLLLASAPGGAYQLEFLRLAMMQRCAELRCRTLGAQDAGSIPAIVSQARYTLVLLTGDASQPPQPIADCPAIHSSPPPSRICPAAHLLTMGVGAGSQVVAEVLTAMVAEQHSSSGRLLLLHEMDTRHCGLYEFDDYVKRTPVDLRAAFKGTISRQFERLLSKREGVVLELLGKLGAVLLSEGPLSTPPLPLFFSQKAVEKDLADVTAAVLSLQGVCAIGGQGGMGKSTLAAALASSPAVKECFQDAVLWLTVGRGAGALEVRRGLQLVLEELVAAPPTMAATLDDLAHSVRAALEMRSSAALLIMDDLSPQHFPVLSQAVPRVGLCKVVITTREVHNFEAAVLQQAAMCHFKELSGLQASNAAALLAETAGISELSLSAETLESLARASGQSHASETCSPFAVQVVAGALRAMMERPNRTGSSDKVVAAAYAASLTTELAEAHQQALLADASQNAASSEISSNMTVFKAIELTLNKAHVDEEMFATFGLFKEDAQVPEEILGIAWRMGVGKKAVLRVAAFIGALEQLSLIKRGRPGCVQLHDAAWEYVITRGGGSQEAHSNFLDRVAELTGGSTEEWWRPPAGAGHPTVVYLAEQLLEHCTEAGRVGAATELCFSLPWLQHTLGLLGGNGLLKEITSHIQQCVQHPDMLTSQDFADLKLLLSTIEISLPGLVAQGRTDGLPEALPTQLLGRLGGLPLDDSSRLKRLLQQAWEWRGDFFWLRPIFPNLTPPQTRTVKVIENTARAYSGVILDDGRVIIAPGVKPRLSLKDDPSHFTLTIFDPSTELLKPFGNNGNACHSICTVKLTQKMRPIHPESSVFIVIASNDGDIRVFDEFPRLRAHYVWGGIEGGHSGVGKAVRCLCDLGDGRVLSGGDDGKIVVWDLEMDLTNALSPLSFAGNIGKTLAACVLGGKSVTSCQQVVTGSWDYEQSNQGVLCFWAVPSRGSLLPVQLLCHIKWEDTIAVDDLLCLGGTVFVSCGGTGSKGKISVWEWQSDYETSTGNALSVTPIATIARASHEWGPSLYKATKDGILCMCRIAENEFAAGTHSGQLLHFLYKNGELTLLSASNPHSTAISGICAHPSNLQAGSNKKLVTTFSPDHTAHVSNMELPFFAPLGHSDFVTGLSVSPLHCVTSGDGNSFLDWDPLKGTPITAGMSTAAAILSLGTLSKKTTSSRLYSPALNRVAPVYVGSEVKCSLQLAVPSTAAQLFDGNAQLQETFGGFESTSSAHVHVVGVLSGGVHFFEQVPAHGIPWKGIECFNVWWARVHQRIEIPPTRKSLPSKFAGGGKGCYVAPGKRNNPPSVGEQ